jgi:hypothetical protein
VFEGKNVFICICTKRELVASARDVRAEPDIGNYIREVDLEWKTSDWILQEIGLARGRGCTSIVLVENGVRNPVPLLADIQYIPFDRDRPEKCL